MEQGAMQYRPTTEAGIPHRRRAGGLPDDDLIELVDDPVDERPGPQTQQPWRVLIADDDSSVHEATVAALAGQRIHDRPIDFVHAYSARETVALLAAGDPVHLVLLDVVMESPEAGLRAVDEIRETLGLRDLKIVIRTGQPGLKPEREIRRSYAIDGYANKAELTRSMLREVIASALAPSAATGRAH
ncbi:MAG: response regulator [Rhodocyclaceae bacterium]|nr:response regulator [Rhodocyclaceae bacterium]